MPKAEYRTVDDYIAAQPESVKPVLEQFRRAIRKALPKAVETISYKIPAYNTPRGTVIYFAAWKKHVSLYPASRKLIAAFKGDLGGCSINKSTLRFPLGEPVPVKLIARIAKFRAREQAERANRKSKPKETA